jgi:DNA-binding NarL/FixJ family response regulator
MTDLSNDRLRTLLVDGSETFLIGVLAWIDTRDDLDVVGTARSGTEAVALTRTLKPDLVVLDGVLPGLDGFRVARILKESPRPPLVVLTTFLTNEVVRDEALRGGADGFVSKSDFAAEFELLLPELLAVRTVARRELRRPARSDRPGSQTEPAP